MYVSPLCLNLLSDHSRTLNLFDTVTCLWSITKKTLDKKAKRERKEALRFDKNGPDRTVYGIFLFVYDNRQVLFYVTDDLLVSLIVHTNKHIIWVLIKNQFRRSSSRK